MRKKVIVYGFGNFYKKVKEDISKEAEIVAYANSSLENATSKTGCLYEGKKILAPYEIKDQEFDSVYICTEPYNANPIYETLILNGITSDKIEFMWKRDAISGSWVDIPNELGDGFVSDINGIKILQRYHTDFDFVPEIFYYNTYYLDMGSDESVVIDIGMNIGISCLYFASKEEVTKVYGFEPFLDTYNQALYNFGLNDKKIADKIEAYNYGLTDRDEDKYISMNAKESGYRSILSQASDENSVHIVCKSAGKVVNDIIEASRGKKIILKIDTEGSEYAIFDSLVKEECFSKIDAVLMEYHNGADSLIDILRKNSFKVLLHGPKNKLGMLYGIR